MRTFIIRDFPDLDHIFPIMNYFLKKKNKIQILSFEVNFDLYQDIRIKYLKKNYKKNIDIKNVYSIKGERFLIDRLLNFISSENYVNINFKNFKNIKKNFLNFFFYY